MIEMPAADYAAGILSYNYFFNISGSHGVQEAIIVHPEADSAAYGIVATALSDIYNDVVTAAANDLQPLIRTGKSG